MKKYAKSKEWLIRAKQVIPGAAQTYSKSYRYFVEGAAPQFLDRGLAGHVWDIDGNEFIDFVCALGPVTIGYNNKQVNDAVAAQLKKGISFSQSTILEIKLAEKLVEIVPCAEMVKLVKNGSDATTAAVRLARAHTSKDMVACCGYHGYHDWYVGSTINCNGVPEPVKKLTTTFEYNDIESAKQVFEKFKGKIAAVILEPCQANGPKDNFLQELKDLTHKNGAVLIFDEVVSGFRMALGGAQEYYNVIPDMTAVGKGMANGLSVSALVGPKKIMGLIDKDVFISTTFGGETLPLAGALATIKLLESKETFPYIIKLGEIWMSRVGEMIKAKNLDKAVKLYGISPHCGVKFNNHGKLSDLDLLSVYQQSLLSDGILSVGINNFCLEHTMEDVEISINSVDKALDVVKESIDNDKIKLSAKRIRPIFRRE